MTDWFGLKAVSELRHAYEEISSLVRKFTSEKSLKLLRFTEWLWHVWSLAEKLGAYAEFSYAPPTNQDRLWVASVQSRRNWPVLEETQKLNETANENT